MRNTKNQKLGLNIMICYGVGSLGEGIGYNVFFAFFIFFMTTVAGISPAIAGTVSTISVLWDAITDPMIGAWSDRTRNKHGRAAPLSVGAPCCSACPLHCCSSTSIFPRTSKRHTISSSICFTG